MATAKKIATKVPTAATPQAQSSVDNATPAKKVVAKPMAKSPVKAVVKAATKAPAPKKATVKKAASKPVADKPAKPKKPKLIRDSFTIPKAEYGVLEELKQRAAQLAHPIKKSELIRASIKVLASLSGAAFLTALNQVPIIKTGRPSAKK
jgi:hypothetical protein